MNAMKLAMVAAEEFAMLRARNDVARAEQVERTIDDLVGRWTTRGFVWPPKVAAVAGVESLRLRRAVR